MQVPIIKLGQAAEAGRVIYTSEAFLNPYFRIVAQFIAIGLWIVEIVLGFTLVSWWAGLFLWIPAVLIATLLVEMFGYEISSLVGFVVVIGSAVSFLL